MDFSGDTECHVIECNGTCARPVAALPRRFIAGIALRSRLARYTGVDVIERPNVDRVKVNCGDAVRGEGSSNLRAVLGGVVHGLIDEIGKPLAAYKPTE